MKYYSTNRLSEMVDFKEATLLGLAPDKGLFFPEFIPQHEAAFFEVMDKMSNEEIAFQVLRPYVGDTIPENVFREIISDTLSFEIPLVRINERIASLELFHGPTFAFKDLGARFMSRCMGYFARNSGKRMIVLVATSGDTGGAVANGFYGVDGVDVVILYPSGRVSDIQERQLTTLGGNIHALRVDGTFDDCQRMVKQAFADRALREQLFLTSANSINVARWLPQQLFYYFGYKQWKQKNVKPVVAVPSGNFGNVCSGMLAKAAGLPLKKFVIACNQNDAVIEYLNSGAYSGKETIATLSNAMDVGDPSNFVRIQEIYKHNFSQMKEDMAGYSVSDEDTLETMKNVYRDFHYELDPHGAVAYFSLQNYLDDHLAEKGFLLETAHPVKFDCALTGEGVLPSDLQVKIDALNLAKKEFGSISADYEMLRIELQSFV
ncbi:MAG: threonine synthase [Bacteroidales bacterium]